MSVYGETDDSCVVDQDVNQFTDRVDTATAEILEQMRLLKLKQAIIEERCEKYGISIRPNAQPSVETETGGLTLEGLSGQMKTIQGLVEKLLTPPPLANNFATPGSSRFDRKPVLHNNKVPEVLTRNYIPDQDPTPQIKLKDAIETVPNFNGHNIPVEQFARACNRAKAVVPPQAEPQLARLLRNKLQDHASLAVEDKGFNSVNDLIKQLKRTFSPAKTSDHYRGELANVIKGTNEHVLEYISRVKDLRFAILEEDREYYRDFARNHPEDLDRLTLDSFVDGLPPHIRTRLLQHNFDTLEEAFELTILVDKKIDRDRQRFSEQKAPKIICQVCNKKGHDALSCRNNQNLASQPTERYTQNPVAGYGNQAPNPLLPYWDKNRPPPPRPTELRICAYCKKPGHLISECRKRLFNRNERNPGTFQERDSGNALPLRSTMEAYRGTGQAAARPIIISQEEPGMSRLGSPPHG